MQPSGQQSGNARLFGGQGPLIYPTLLQYLCAAVIEFGTMFLQQTNPR